ncbi:MAG: TldD/PmbA family protein [Dehalococcoidia bacterium]
MAPCEQAAFDFDHRISNSDGAGFSNSVSTVMLVNSRGFSGSYRSSAASIGVEVMADDADRKKRNDSWYTVERSLIRLESPEAVGRRAAERALGKLGARKVGTQRAPVVFDPRAARGLIGVRAGAVSGAALERRSSFLIDQVGQQAGSALLTLTDNALLPGQIGSRPFDGEGVASRANLVFDEGLFKTFLFDTYTARRTGHQSTGNCSRSAGGPTGVGISNFLLQAGGVSPDEIIRSVENGLYLTDMIGFGVNLTTGDFSRGAAGIWIEHGRLSYPVSESTISGNLREMLRELERVGNDLLWTGSIAAPTIKLRSLMIGGL